MASHASPPANDYWANGIELGTLASWMFEGVDGLERLSGPAAITAPPSGFTAQLTRVQLDHVALEQFRATAHRAERTPDRIDAYPTPLLTFLLLAEGTVDFELAGTAFELHAGEFVVVDSRDPFAYSTSGPVRMLRSVVGIEHVPEALHRRGATVPGPLQRTALTESFIAFISAILRASSEGRRATGDHLIQSVADLQSAVLAEAQHSSRQPGQAGLRYRMEQFIEANYTDPELDPTAVAQALGISLRHAHTVFDDGDRTLARYIQDRRVAAVAVELRTRHYPAPFTHLARQYGFGSADTLGRAFRQRLGMSLKEYRSGGHRSFG